MSWVWWVVVVVGVLCGEAWRVGVVWWVVIILRAPVALLIPLVRLVCLQRALGVVFGGEGWSWDGGGGCGVGVVAAVVAVVVVVLVVVFAVVVV